MSNQESQRIWYVAYGSNLSKKRFWSYIEGGFAPGGLIPQLGCTDKSLPVRDEPLLLDQGLYFGDFESPTWNGAPVFLDEKPGTAPTKARGYLITPEQFWEIVQDENHLTDPVQPIDIEEIKSLGSLVLEDVAAAGSQYPRVMYLGERDDYSMFTFTAAEPHAKVKPPNTTYIQTMAIGLGESHGLPASEIAAYLAGIRGIIDHYDPTILTTIVQAAPPPRQ